MKPQVIKLLNCGFLTAAGLYADLQAQVMHRTHHPEVAGRCDVKLQPSLLSSPKPARLKKEQVCLPKGKNKTKKQGKVNHCFSLSF